MKLSIRQAVPADADILAQFNVELAKESEHLALEPARVRAGVEALLRDPAKGVYFVAEAGGVVVGQRRFLVAAKRLCAAGGPAARRF
jgi:hypothetical protein